MTKSVRGAIMKRSELENKYYRYKTQESGVAYKKQKNYTKRLIRKEKKKYFANLNLNNYTDNKNSGILLSLYFLTMKEGRKK